MNFKSDYLKIEKYLDQKFNSDYSNVLAWRFISLDFTKKDMCFHIKLMRHGGLGIGHFEYRYCLSYFEINQGLFPSAFLLNLEKHASEWRPFNEN